MHVGCTYGANCVKTWEKIKEKWKELRIAPQLFYLLSLSTTMTPKFTHLVLFSIPTLSVWMIERNNDLFLFDSDSLGKSCI